jgi:hypothetical protein
LIWLTKLLGGGSTNGLSLSQIVGMVDLINNALMNVEYSWV